MLEIERADVGTVEAEYGELRWLKSMTETNIKI